MANTRTARLYDGLGRARKEEVAAVAGGWLEFKYDAVGHRVDVKDSWNGGQRSQYDSAGRLE